MNKLIHIFGAGKLAECAIDMIINENLYSDIIVYDDHKLSVQVGNIKFTVQGSIDEGRRIVSESGNDFIVLLGMNYRDKALEIINEFKNAGLNPINLISGFAHISKSVKLGCNAMVFPGAVIG